MRSGVSITNLRHAMPRLTPERSTIRGTTRASLSLRTTTATRVAWEPGERLSNYNY